MSATLAPRPRRASHNLFWLAAIFVAFSVFSIQSFGAQLSLAWNASPSTSVTGYKLYYGQVSGNYTSSSDVGNRLDYTVGGLTSGQNYYFAVTAYNATGAQSAFSNEVSGTAPAAPAATVNIAPTGTITSPTANVTVTRGSAVSFTGAGTDPDNNTPLSYSWNFGNGATPSTSTEQNPTVTFGTAGTYTASLTVKDSKLLAATTPATRVITVTAPSTTATTPVANPDRYTVQTGTTLSVAAPGVLSNDTSPSGKSLTAKGVANVTPGTGSLKFYSSGRFTFTPASGFVGTTTFTYTASDGTTTSSLATVTINVTAPAAASTTIWPATAVPANLDRDDSTPVNLGVRFTSSKNGYVTGIRFYKSLANTGTHIGSLWTSDGTNLAKASFTNETASGWQQVNFATPVPITANTVYVVSYFAPNGHFSWDDNYFANAGVTSGPLTALRNDPTNRNGVFAYGSGPVYPAFGYYPRNYWVDVEFKSTQ